LDATIVTITDAVQTGRLRDRERPQHDGVDQREDRGCAADAEGQRQHGGDGEHRRLSKLSKRVTESAQKSSHCDLGRKAIDKR
jgi:hypothetical protein